MLADLVVIAFMVLSVYMGYKRGFIRTVSKLLSFVISIILARILHPVISGYVKKSFIGDFINTNIADKTRAVNESTPTFIKEAASTTANELSDAAVSVVTIILIIIVTFIAVNFIIKALNIVSKLPVLSFVNRMCGIVAGLFTGVLTVYVVLAVVAIINIDASWMQGSTVAKEMFKNNILMNIIF